MKYLPDFSRLQSRLLNVVSCIAISVCCLWVSVHGHAPRSGLTPQWGALDCDRHADRIADWAAQLPLGEALREGIVGFAIA
jgi:hypothetical protein